jgi:hypothetical protein
VGELTVSIWAELRNDISNTDVDDTQETLVLLLEFLLVKDLNCEDAIFVGATNECELMGFFVIRWRGTLQVKALIPVWV